MKVSIAELEHYVENVKENCRQLKSDLKDLKGKIQVFIDCSSLKGEAVEAQKKYLQNIHINVINEMCRAATAFFAESQKIIEEFQEEVDSSSKAYIAEARLEDALEKTGRLEGSIKDINDNLGVLISKLSKYQVYAGSDYTRPDFSRIEREYKNLKGIITDAQNDFVRYNDRCLGSIKRSEFADSYHAALRLINQANELRVKKLMNPAIADMDKKLLEHKMISRGPLIKNTNVRVADGPAIQAPVVNKEEASKAEQMIDEIGSYLKAAGNCLEGVADAVVNNVVPKDPFRDRVKEKNEEDDYSKPKEYYIGRVIGDVVLQGIGAAEAIVGAVGAAATVVGGTAGSIVAAPSTGGAGTVAIAGVSVEAVGAELAFAAQGAYVCSNATEAVAEDISKLSKSGEGSGSGGSNGEGSSSIPDKARNIANQVKAKKGAAPQGYKGGRTYKNIPLEDGAQKLPEGINYKEYDVDPYIKGQNRGAERIVIGDDGSVWYTNDHYFTFTQIE